MENQRGKMNFRRFTLLVTLVGSSCFAQDVKQVETKEVENLDDVVVTATRTKIKEEQVARSITVITAEDIEREQPHSFLSMLNGVPGVNIKSDGSHSASSSISIRGMRGYHTKVMINGMTIQDPSGTQTKAILSTISLDNIERVEIIRGASSTLYGSNAMGGVINIITKKGTEDGLSGELGSEFGSYGYQKYNAALRGVQGKFDYAFSTEWMGEEGISSKKDNSERDSFRSSSTNVDLGYQFTDQLKLSGFTRYSDSDEEYDDGFSNPKNRGSFHIIDLQLGTKLAAERLFDGIFDTSIGFNYSKVRRADSEGTAFYMGQTFETDWQNVWRINDRNRILFGMTYTEEKAEKDFYGTTSNRARTDSYYGQYEVEPIDNLFLTSGIRYSNHSEFGGDTTYSLSAAYLIKETGTKLKSSFATGYRAPSLYELNYRPALGTLDLKPEKSQSFDIGFEQTVNESIEFGMNFFNNRVTDYIGYNPGAGWPAPDYYEQASGIKIYGVESYIKITPIESVTLDFNHTYQHTNNMDTEIAPMVYQPSNTFGASVNWKVDHKWNLNLNANYVGQREYDVYVWPAGNVRSSEKLHGYTLVNFATRYDITKSLQVYGRIDNLLDQDYEVSEGYNTYGITTYVGMKYLF